LDITHHDAIARRRTVLRRSLLSECHYVVLQNSLTRLAEQVEISAMWSLSRRMREASG
jgi:hypothetical protein